MAVECENARVINRSHIEDVDADKAWDKMVEAAKIRDMDDVKEAFQEYIKSTPETTYQAVEKGLRDQGHPLYIIAIEKPQLVGALTNMDLQGNLGKKYTVTFRFEDKPLRERERQFFPKDAAENMERLNDAGEPVDSGKMKCSNCSEYGHISKNCPEEKVEKEQPVVKCFHCGEEGHRVRDCKFASLENIQFQAVLTKQALNLASTSSLARIASSPATRLLSVSRSNICFPLLRSLANDI